MNQFYDRIMEIKEADEVKKIVKRWDVLSANITTRPIDAPVLLPDMLWIAKSGVGKTVLLNLIAEYLALQGNLMEFYGDVKFFEFLLGYCSPRDQFSELQRLIDEVNNAAGFRSEFKGIIHIDINEWLDHFEEKHFVTFMEYLSAHSDKWLVVLSVYSENKTKLHNLNAFLAMYLRIERITLSLPKTANLFEYIERNLHDYGLSLDEGGKAVLFETIERLRKNKHFDGFKTIKLLCQDIVYKTFSNKTVDSFVLTAEAIEDFSADSEYVERMIANIEKVRQIGFESKR